MSLSSPTRHQAYGTYRVLFRTQRASFSNRRLTLRGYATQSSLGGSNSTPSSPPRKAITVASDDGRYKWSELSTREKAARSTQQSFNFLVVLAGAVGTIGIIYLLYVELFAADSKTRQFNHAVDRIKADDRCIELLGPAKQIRAFGEPTTSKWARHRPLAHNVEVDKFGTTHFRMHFHVEGPENAGIAHVYMTKGREQTELVYKTLSLNVKGHPIVFLENTNDSSPKKAAAKMFGIRWR